MQILGEAYNVSLAPASRGIQSLVDPYGSAQRYEYAPGGQMVKLWTTSSALPHVAEYIPSSGLLKRLSLPSGSTFIPNPPQGLLGLSTQTKQPSVKASADGKTIQLVYAGGAEEVLFERVDTPSMDDEDHASWQIGRRIRVFVQSKQPTPFPTRKNARSTNVTTQAPRLIENL